MTFILRILLYCRDYLDRTAEEINETLQESGQVTVAELAKTFNFPADFLLSVSLFLGKASG